MVDAQRELEILQAAQDLFAQEPDWVDFFRKILGLGGVVRQRFPSVSAMRQFETTETYIQIQTMLRHLRERQPVQKPREPSPSQEANREPTQVITVRLPRSLHDALRVEAHEHRTSMNKLCISKLLQFIDNGLVPTEQPVNRIASEITEEA